MSRLCFFGGRRDFELDSPGFLVQWPLLDWLLKLFSIRNNQNWNQLDFRHYPKQNIRFGRFYIETTSFGVSVEPKLTGTNQNKSKQAKKMVELGILLPNFSNLPPVLSAASCHFPERVCCCSNSSLCCLDVYCMLPLDVPSLQQPLLPSNKSTLHRPVRATPGCVCSTGTYAASGHICSTVACASLSYICTADCASWMLLSHISMCCHWTRLVSGSLCCTWTMTWLFTLYSRLFQESN
jgi:hypothetical protein